MYNYFSLRHRKLFPKSSTRNLYYGGVIVLSHSMQFLVSFILFFKKNVFLFVWFGDP